MKIIDKNTLKETSVYKKNILAALLILFVILVTLTEINNPVTIIKIILYSCALSLIVIKVLFLSKLSKKVKQLSTGAAIVLGYIIPKILIRSIDSKFLEVFMFWVVLELGLFLYIKHPTLFVKENEIIKK